MTNHIVKFKYREKNNQFVVRNRFIIDFIILSDIPIVLNTWKKGYSLHLFRLKVTFCLIVACLQCPEKNALNWKTDRKTASKVTVMWEKLHKKWLWFFISFYSDHFIEIFNSCHAFIAVFFLRFLYWDARFTLENDRCLL